MKRGERLGAQPDRRRVVEHLVRVDGAVLVEVVDQLEVGVGGKPAQVERDVAGGVEVPVLLVYEGGVVDLEAVNLLGVGGVQRARHGQGRRQSAEVDRGRGKAATTGRAARGGERPGGASAPGRGPAPGWTTEAGDVEVHVVVLARGEPHIHPTDRRAEEPRVVVEDPVRARVDEGLEYAPHSGFGLGVDQQPEVVQLGGQGGRGRSTQSASPQSVREVGRHVHVARPVGVAVPDDDAAGGSRRPHEAARNPVRAHRSEQERVRDVVDVEAAAGVVGMAWRGVANQEGRPARN